MIVVKTLKIFIGLSIIITLVLKLSVQYVKVLKHCPKKIAIMTELLFFLMCRRFGKFSRDHVSKTNNTKYKFK